MPKFFIPQIYDNCAEITGADARHIGLSLRMRVGEQLTVSAGGNDYRCEITAITPERVVLNVLAKLEDTAEPSVSLTLYQAVPKSDKLEQIVQKSVELGASRIVPVLTSRCVSRPKPADFVKKQARLKKIAESAAKQSGRSVIPEVASLYSFAQMCEELSQSVCSLLFYEGGGKRLSELALQDAAEIAVVIGSEGGFSADEAAQIESAGAVPVWLGKRILRCETAPLAAISILMYLTGNL